MEARRRNAWAKQGHAWSTAMRAGPRCGVRGHGLGNTLASLNLDLRLQERTPQGKLVPAGV